MKMLAGIPNQDAVLPAVGPGVSFLAVCDGISQCTVGSGDLASGLAVRMMANLWDRQRDRVARGGAETARAFLDDALDGANRAVCAAVVQLTGGVLLPGTSMGTTAVVAVINGNHAEIASLGDSRVYLVGDWGVALLTADQNLDLQRFQAATRGDPIPWSGPGKGLLGFVGHFGGDGHPELLPVAHRSVRMLPGERLVLCSDGITDYVASDEGGVQAALGRIVRRVPAQDAASSLVDAANQGGGGDNASVIVACTCVETPGRAEAGWEDAARACDDVRSRRG